MTTGYAADYESDFLAWAREQAKLARSGQVNALDLPHIAEELEAMGRAERHKLASQLIRLMAHLLKWKYQPTRRSPSWRNSIRTSRLEIKQLLKTSPSLARTLSDTVIDDWPDAVDWAADETGLPRATFPTACPWIEAELRDTNFWPD